MLPACAGAGVAPIPLCPLSLLAALCVPHASVGSQYSKYTGRAGGGRGFGGGGVTSASGASAGGGGGGMVGMGLGRTTPYADPNRSPLRQPTRRPSRGGAQRAVATARRARAVPCLGSTTRPLITSSFETTLQ